MKKSKIFLSAIALIASSVFISSCGGDKGSDTPAVVVASKIKKISLNDGFAIESWDFTYDASKRVLSISNVYDGGTPEIIAYDYTVANKLTIDKAGSKTVYVLDAAGRVIKELWDVAGTEWEGYEYDADGVMKKVIEHYSGADHLKYDLTILSSNITNRIRYEDDGVSKREDRVYSYTSGDNLSAIPQIYAVDSEWKNIGGTFGKPNKKLLASYVRKITADPTSTWGATYVYTFDAKNRVATQTKNGTGSGGPFTESWTYTYYED
jgi:hypothetical protein